MKPEELDRALSGEADIVPSSGFVAAVMDAVATEATSPPLKFPWKRALPLASAFPALLVWSAFVLTTPGLTAPGPGLYAWFESIVPMATGWVAGGLLMTVALTAWSLRLVRPR
jgi:hypothetical protein